MCYVWLTHKYSCTVCSSLLEYSCWLSICKHIFIVHCNSKISQLHIILRIHWKSPHISEEEEERNKKQSTNICKSAYGRWRTMMNWWLLLFYQIIYRSSFLRRVSCFSSNFLESHSQRNKNEEKNEIENFSVHMSVGRDGGGAVVVDFFFALPAIAESDRSVQTVASSHDHDTCTQSARIQK